MAATQHPPLVARGSPVETLSLAINIAALVLAAVALWTSYYMARIALAPADRELRITVEAFPIEDSNTYHLEVHIASASHHAVTSEHFDQGRPLVLSSVSPLWDLQCISSFARLDGEHRIAIGPDLFGSGHTNSFLVTTGPLPDLLVREHYLIDTWVQLTTTFRKYPRSEKDADQVVREVQAEHRRHWERQRARTLTASAALVATAILIVALVLP
jgi:hypothetical protein